MTNVEDLLSILKTGFLVSREEAKRKYEPTFKHNVLLTTEIILSTPKYLKEKVRLAINPKYKTYNYFTKNPDSNALIVYEFDQIFLEYFKRITSNIETGQFPSESTRTKVYRSNDFDKLIELLKIKKEELNNYEFLLDYYVPNDFIKLIIIRNTNPQSIKSQIDEYAKKYGFDYYIIDGEFITNINLLKQRSICNGLEYKKIIPSILERLPKSESEKFDEKRRKEQEQTEFLKSKNIAGWYKIESIQNRYITYKDYRGIPYTIDNKGLSIEGDFVYINKNVYK